MDLNLVKLYTHNGPVWIDTRQLNTDRLMLRIYDAKGRKVSDAGRTRAARDAASYGVHRANLYASPALAADDRERILSGLFSPNPEPALSPR